jgi:hypothetical protein
MSMDFLPAVVQDLVPPARSAAGWALRTGIDASLIALLVLAAQHLLRHRISARWRHNLWLLVLARLVLPAVPGTSVSPFNLIPSFADHTDPAAGPSKSPTAPVPMPARRAAPLVQTPIFVSATPATGASQPAIGSGATAVREPPQWTRIVPRPLAGAFGPMSQEPSATTVAPRQRTESPVAETPAPIATASPASLRPRDASSIQASAEVVLRDRPSADLAALPVIDPHGNADQVSADQVPAAAGLSAKLSCNGPISSRSRGPSSRWPCSCVSPGPACA